MISQVLWYISWYGGERTNRKEIKVAIRDPTPARMTMALVSLLPVPPEATTKSLPMTAG